ncbi:MAG: glyoxalase [Alphaproteobacteria bacterium HGW-Alphaproteobacteria-12]|nr:MAG: glyoxalase [Alphaproteobacteria bacterium HGW-Alphaproteobacteria-12]
MSNELLGTVAHIGEAKTPAPKITGFHHIAYRCRDADETQKFYIDLLGLKPAAALAFDRDPGGKDRPFMHLFFEMGDGKFIAFFDEPGSADDAVFRMKDGIEDYHFAFEVATRVELDDFIARLKEAKVPVFGPIDHHFCHSIYFFDPNGLACEITVRDEKHDEIMEAEGGRVAQAIREWTEKTRVLKKARLKLLNAAD